MDRHLVPRPRARRRLFGPMAPVNAAIAIQAAARGFLARRRAARLGMRRNRRLLSPMDIKRITRKVKRPQGQVKVPKVFPKARIGSLVGTEQSKRSVSMRKVDPLVIKSHIDINSEVQQSQVAYFGFADAGWQSDILDQGCFALTNMFFRRAGIKLPTLDVTVDQALSQPPDAPPEYFNVKLRRIVLLFNNIAQDGTHSSATREIDVNDNSTIRDCAADIKAAILDNANAQTVTSQKWPIVAKLFSRRYFDYTDGVRTEYNLFATYDLENTMVEFAYKRKYKWVNTTPAGEGGVGGNTNINDINANPLSGKIYKFKGPTPLVRARIKDYHPELSLDGIERQEVSNSSALLCNRFRIGNNYGNNPYGPFRQPFKAVQFFKNTETEDKVYMPPGGYKQIIRSGKHVMNFKRFCQACIVIETNVMIPDGQPPAPKIGTCTLWALEPALRTDVNELVKLHVNAETWYTTKCRVGEKKQPVATDAQVHEGPTFGAI